MELTAECEKRHEKLGKMWYCIFNDGKGGLVNDVEELKEWRKTIDALINQLKGFKVVVLLASIITAIATIANYLKP